MRDFCGLWKSVNFYAPSVRFVTVCAGFRAICPAYNAHPWAAVLGRKRPKTHKKVAKLQQSRAEKTSTQDPIWSPFFDFQNLQKTGLKSIKLYI